MLDWGLGSFKAMSSMTLRSLALLGIYHRQLGTWDGKETASSSRLAFVFSVRYTLLSTYIPQFSTVPCRLYVHFGRTDTRMQDT